MNKENLNKIILSGGIVDLDKFVDNVEVTVNKNTTLNAINLHNNLKLFIKVKTNCTLVLNIFDYAVSLETKVSVELDDGSKLIFNNAFISEEKYSLDIDTKLYGNDIDVQVNIRGINEENGTTYISMNGRVAGLTHNSHLNEYAKVINKSNNSAVLIPNMFVDTNDVEANHGVSIGNLALDEIFYLQSKGINEEEARKMLENGFLLSIMDIDTKEKIQNILVGR